MTRCTRLREVFASVRVTAAALPRPADIVPSLCIDVPCGRAESPRFCSFDSFSPAYSCYKLLSHPRSQGGFKRAPKDNHSNRASSCVHRWRDAGSRWVFGAVVRSSSDGKIAPGFSPIYRCLGFFYIILKPKKRWRSSTRAASEVYRPSHDNKSELQESVIDATICSQGDLYLVGYGRP